MRASHEIEIGVPPGEVWRALVEPELTRRWYHGALVAGDWQPGGEVTYGLPGGMVLERGTVLDIVEGLRLELETRFTWDESVSAEPAHRTLWELEPAADGTRVRVNFEVPDTAPATSHRLREEGGYLPLTLRVALDPGEQARLARRSVIGEVEIRDLTADMVDDYQHFFDDVGFADHPVWQGCYCGETNLAPQPRLGVHATREAMSELVRQRDVTALLAFAEGEPVAWCNYGETTRLAGVMAKLGLESADHDRVGSIACFVIASQYRRHGLARRLLEVACERLRERGCAQVEAYPPKDSDSDYPNYRGPLAMYLGAGFELFREAGRTMIVRKSL